MDSSPASGEANALTGDWRYVLLTGVDGVPNPAYAGAIPRRTFPVFALIPAPVIGFAASVSGYSIAAALKQTPGYNGPLDASGAAGAGGTLGAIMTGVFATGAVNHGLRDVAGKPAAPRLVDGNQGQIVNQISGAAIAQALAAAGTFVILKMCELTAGSRTSEEEERQGPDLGMHGEEGYSHEL